MDKPIVLCGKTFTPELIEHLSCIQQQNASISNNELARILCEHLSWYSSDGRPAKSSAKVALRKLRHRGVLYGPERKCVHRPSHRLRSSGEPLPGVCKVPRRVDEVDGLYLHLLSGQEDPLHLLWNDLIIHQHPCGNAPMVGPQLRFLIGSNHGWLGALGFGPAAFVLGARDQWIGWSTSARVSHLHQVVGLGRFLIRQEVHCQNLASKVLSMALERLCQDWKARYAVDPVLVETFVDRERFTGRCFSAGNWRRIGSSTGRGRLGPKQPTVSFKDIWVYELVPQARRLLQEEMLPPLTPRPLLSSLAQEDWCAAELDSLALGEKRRGERAVRILEARWAQPQASFNGSFDCWADAKGAYELIRHPSLTVSLENLLAPHVQATQERMAAEEVVLLPQDTTTLNYSGLKKTTGLGPLGEARGRGLWLHSLLAYRPDGVPLGVLQGKCWSRPESGRAAKAGRRGRNAKSIDEKESERWLEGLRTAAAAARRMPQTQLVVITDREGDLYELHDAVQIGPPNLHTLIRAQHDRNLQSHQKLWAFMRELPVGETRTLDIPRRHGQSARQATVEVRWSPIVIEAPRVGCKKSWPPLNLYAVWVYEPNPPGVDGIDWMLLTDLPVRTAAEAWEKVQWYRVRWGIEEWHRALKSGCNIEGREFKTAEHLKRALTFDLIIGWRILACLKLGRMLPQLPARVLYTEDELAVLCVYFTQKKGQELSRSMTLCEANRVIARLGGYLGRNNDGEPGAESLGIGLGRLMDMARIWRMRDQCEAVRR